METGTLVIEEVPAMEVKCGGSTDALSIHKLNSCFKTFYSLTRSRAVLHSHDERSAPGALHNEARYEAIMRYALSLRGFAPSNEI